MADAGRKWTLLFVASGIGVFVGAIFLWIQFSASGATVSFISQSAGAPCTVRIAGLPQHLALDEIGRQVQAAIDRCDEALSASRPDSDVARFNTSESTDWFAVSLHTARAVETSLDVGARSGGCYDVTVVGLTGVWDAAVAGGLASPSADALVDARLLVGQAMLEARLDPPALRKRKFGLRIDLADLVEGFVVDEAARALERSRLGDYCVTLDGHARCRGQNAGFKPWDTNLAVEAAGTECRRAVPLRNRSMATAIDLPESRRFRTIDPRSGNPITHDVIAVTVVDSNAERASAWARALLVAGPRQGWDLAIRERLPALFVLKDGSTLSQKPTPLFPVP